MFPLYSILVCRGLENIAIEELHTRLSGKEKLTVVDQKPGRIIFQYTGDPRQLLTLRSVEYVFLVLRRLSQMTHSRNSLATLKKSLTRLDLRPHFDICRQAGIRLRKRLTCRVTSRLSGQRNFRRIDAQRVIEQALMNLGWRLTAESSALDIWVEIHGNDGYLSIRLSPLDMPKRDYKTAHISASLKPTIAYALVHLSDPQTDDVFLDPMCGAGTILIERAHSERHRALLGGDISRDALQASQTNIGPKHKPRQLFHWDARSLPLARWSVDKIVCNLPFGQKIEADRELYQRFVKESARILKPTGRMVLLTTQQSLLEDLVKRQKTIRIAQRLRIDLLGLNSWIYVCMPR